MSEPERGADGRYHAPPQPGQGRVKGGGGGAFSVKNGASIHAHVEYRIGRTQSQFHRSIDFMTSTGEPTTSVWQSPGYCRITLSAPSVPCLSSMISTVPNVSGVSHAIVYALIVPIVPLRGIACRMAVSAEHGSAAATSSAASGARVILSPASVLLRLKLRRLTDWPSRGAAA